MTFSLFFELLFFLSQSILNLFQPFFHQNFRLFQLDKMARTHKGKGSWYWYKARTSTLEAEISTLQATINDLRSQIQLLQEAKPIQEPAFEPLANFGNFSLFFSIVFANFSLILLRFRANFRFQRLSTSTNYRSTWPRGPR